MDVPGLWLRTGLKLRISSRRGWRWKSLGNQGWPSDNQVAQPPSSAHRTPGMPCKRSNLPLSSPTVTTIVCHHLSTFKCLLSPTNLVAQVNNWLCRSTTYLLFAHTKDRKQINFTIWNIQWSEIGCTVGLPVSNRIPSSQITGLWSRHRGTKS